MNHTTKTSTLGIAIAAVTLALVTATVVTVIVVSMIPVQKVAAFDGGEHCITSPKGEACSGSQGSASCSAPGGCLIIPGSGTSSSVSIDSKGLHQSFSCSKGSTSSNAGHPSATSGKACP